MLGAFEQQDDFVKEQKIQFPTGRVEMQDFSPMEIEIHGTKYSRCTNSSKGMENLEHE